MYIQYDCASLDLCHILATILGRYLQKSLQEFHHVHLLRREGPQYVGIRDLIILLPNLAHESNDSKHYPEPHKPHGFALNLALALPID